MISSVGPYQIVSEAGRGGMGVVYRARDSRLDRDVAIKALPADVALDPVRLERFEREARTLASLNHPNLAGIYGVEEQDGQKYLVLEYVGGETLAERIDRGTLPLEEALEIAVQIAAGVEAAHEAGVIHRDLKPANVKVTEAGRVKLLDFGLAKPGPDSNNSGPVDLATTVAQHSPTIPGAILGTAAYMSPEQARGRQVDKRTDVWSFGVLLYEMLTGVSPFLGDTATDSIGAVLHKEVDLSRLPERTPSMVRHVLRRCLERDRALRYRDIGDVRIELLRCGDEAPDAGPSPQASRRRAGVGGWVVAALIAASGVAVLGSGVLNGRERIGAVPVRASLPIPAPFRLAIAGAAPGVPQVSPDGRLLAFTSPNESGGSQQLCVMDMLSGKTRILERTGGARYPFWSPDSKSIGFFNGSSLCRIEVAGGPPREIAPASNGKGGTWTGDGKIIFSGSPAEPLAIVPASGGAVERFTTLGGSNGSADNSHRHPFWIPGTDRVLYLRRGADDFSSDARPTTYTRSFDGTVDEAVVQATGNVEFMDGYLFYADGTTLVARPYDPMKNALLGEAVPVAERVLTARAAGLSFFNVSPSGTLTYLDSSLNEDNRTLAWWDAATNSFDVVERNSSISGVLLYAGGSQLLKRANENEAPNRWMSTVDLSSGRERSLNVTLSHATIPAVSPDGTRLAYVSRHENARTRIYVRSLESFTEPDIVTELESQFANIGSWSSDGRYLYGDTYQPVPNTANELTSEMFRIDLESESPSLEIIKTGFEVYSVVASPDGRFLAICGEDRGDPHVFVMDLESTGRVMRVSTQPCNDPKWAAGGKRLFYRTRTSVDMVEIEVAPSGEVVIGNPRSLFQAGQAIRAEDTYAPSSDGERVLVLLPGEDTPSASVGILTDWRSLVGPVP